MEIKTPVYVSIIIPTYKDWNRLKLCIDALYSQSYPQEKFEVLVVNNDPNDSFDQQFTFSNTNVEFLDEQKPGSYAARNKALGQAKGDIIGFTDSDCIPDQYWIENAVKILDANSNIDRIGGRMKMFTAEPKQSLADIYDSLTAFPQQDYVKWGYAVTGNLFVRKELFQKVGTFDSNLMSGGDRKWGMDASKKGCSIVYSDSVIVNHPTRSTIQELVKKKKRVGGGLKNNVQKLNFIKIILITIKTDFVPFKSKMKKRNPNLNVYDQIRVLGLHFYLSIMKNINTYK